MQNHKMKSLPIIVLFMAIVILDLCAGEPLFFNLFSVFGKKSKNKSKLKPSYGSPDSYQTSGMESSIKFTPSSNEIWKPLYNNQFTVTRKPKRRLPDILKFFEKKKNLFGNKRKPKSKKPSYKPPNHTVRPTKKPYQPLKRPQYQPPTSNNKPKPRPSPITTPCPPKIPNQRHNHKKMAPRIARPQKPLPLRFPKPNFPRVVTPNKANRPIQFPPNQQTSNVNPKSPSPSPQQYANPSTPTLPHGNKAIIFLPNNSVVPTTTTAPLHTYFPTLPPANPSPPSPKPISHIKHSSSNHYEEDDEHASPEPSSTGDGWIPIPIANIMEMFSWPQNPPTTEHPAIILQQNNNYNPIQPNPFVQDLDNSIDSEIEIIEEQPLLIDDDDDDDDHTSTESQADENSKYDPDDDSEENQDENPNATETGNRHSRTREKTVVAVVTPTKDKQVPVFREKPFAYPAGHLPKPSPTTARPVVQPSLPSEPETDQESGVPAQLHDPVPPKSPIFPLVEELGIDAPVTDQSEDAVGSEVAAPFLPTADIEEEESPLLEEEGPDTTTVKPPTFGSTVWILGRTTSTPLIPSPRTTTTTTASTTSTATSTTEDSIRNGKALNGNNHIQGVDNIVLPSPLDNLNALANLAYLEENYNDVQTAEPFDYEEYLDQLSDLTTTTTLSSVPLSNIGNEGSSVLISDYQADLDYPNVDQTWVWKTQDTSHPESKDVAKPNAIVNDGKIEPITDSPIIWLDREGKSFESTESQFSGSEEVKGIGQLVNFYPIRGKPFLSFIPKVEYASIVKRK